MCGKGHIGTPMIRVQEEHVPRRSEFSGVLQEPGPFLKITRMFELGGTLKKEVEAQKEALIGHRAGVGLELRFAACHSIFSCSVNMYVLSTSRVPARCRW